jgi:hypothetical protein
VDDREIDRSYMRDFVVRLRFQDGSPREFLVRSTTVRGALSRAIEAEGLVVSAEEGRLVGAEVVEAGSEADRLG